MSRLHFGLVAALFLAGCGGPANDPSADGTVSLADAKRGFQTKLTRQDADHDPPENPPADLFRLVRYESPAGKLAAYVSKHPADGPKRPAIVWIFGGFSNGIGDTAWDRQPASNDQSASAFWRAGVVTMYPSFRGGCDNPGFKEGFFGEVDDVVAAADFLAKQDGVDPNRIFLGGHSTGGTLALLASASAKRFRAVFAFGPADDVDGYGYDHLPFDVFDSRERELRAPKNWIKSIRNPTFVFEGTDKGNIESLRSMACANTNPAVQFYPVPGATHFSLLAPMTRMIATKVLRDNGPSFNIVFTEQELNGVIER